MARLIPSIFDECSPSGERAVFDMISGGPDEWVVFHSLDLAPWNEGRRTEIDFLVIIPDSGILTIEVKSHENIAFLNDQWHPSSIKKSPFKQALDGRFAFYRRLSKKIKALSRVPVCHCCIFPNSRFDLCPNISVQPWELIDRLAFRSYKSSASFCLGLKSLVIQSIKSDPDLKPLKNPITAKQSDDLVNLCIPVRKFRPDKRIEIEERELGLERILTSQQKPVLELAKLNSRLIVSGGAGTGKTLIALEVAKRAAESGERVALVCFNRMIGDWLKDITASENTPPNLVAGRAIQLMLNMLGIKHVNFKQQQDEWGEELLSKVESRLTDPELEEESLFDRLVIDEAQDILSRPWLFQCLTLLLRGKEKSKKFSLFGDFENQVLSSRDLMNSTLSELQRSKPSTNWALSENCRNYPIIGHTAVKLSGLGESVYSGFLRKGGGLNSYDISFYRNDKEQLSLLTGLIKSFSRQGYLAHEMVILSYRSSGASIANKLKNGKRKFIKDKIDGRSTCYTSIHSFKGLDSKIVLITDVVLAGKDYQRYLFYTGLTRATESVRILCHEDSKDTLIDWLSRK